jgi:Uma2 family endonuclease
MVAVSSRAKPSARVRAAEPAWEIAYLFPPQGSWTEDDYLALEDHYGSHVRVELCNGRLEVLPVPTEPHQLIIAFLWRSLDAFINLHAAGVTLFSGIRVRLRVGKHIKFREPDIVYMKAEHATRRHKQFWEGADLVMEVVSGDPKDRNRDWRTKPKDYAAAGIPEYWIVDPYKKVIRVLVLRGKTYRCHGDFKPGSRATSPLLPGFSVSVSEVFAAAAV